MFEFIKLPKAKAAGMLLAVAFLGAPVVAATLSIDAEYTGRTSRGGVNQEAAYDYTGSDGYYADVWNSTFVFDLNAFGGASTNITSAKLVLDVHAFYNDRKEDMTFSLGSFTGDLARLQSLNTFFTSGHGTDPRLYAATMATTYGQTAIPNALAKGDHFSVELNATGLNALNSSANSTMSSMLGMAGSFSYPHSQGSNKQFLITTGAKLEISYAAKAPDPASGPFPTVPLPAGGLLLTTALAGLAIKTRKHR